MLHTLVNLGRSVVFARSRGGSQHFHFNQTASYSVVRNHGSLVRHGFSSRFYRIFSRYKVQSRGYAMYGRNVIKHNGYKYNHAKNFRAVSEGRVSMVHQTRLALLKRHYLIGARGVPRFTLSNWLARAAGLKFTRFLVIRGVLTLCAADLAFADGEYIPIKDSVLMRAQDKSVYFTSFLNSIKEGFILIFRAFYLAMLFSPALVLAIFADRFGPRFRKRWITLVHRTLEKAGPAFIKMGQWVATRPDLFPSDLCMELAKLHSGAPAHSFAYTKSAIEKAFGRKLSEIFDHFEETPVASGSIAQVHRASLIFRYPGQQLKKPIEVAVKVRHPGVGESIRRDFVIINFVAQVSRVIPVSWLKLDEIASQFAGFMLSQVDLAREAAQLSRFAYNFRRWKDVSFPKPLYPLVHPSVLVETFEQGDSVARYIDDEEGNPRIKRDLAHIGTYALLKMLLVDNFIHADMHPGNILVRVPQNKRPRKKLFRVKPHLIFLDVGMTSELSQYDRLNLLEFFKAVAVRDGRTAAECTLKLSKRQKCPNPEAFVEELERTFSFWGTPEGDIFHPAECMHQLLEQVRRHKVSIDGNVCTVLVTILVLEGWQRKLDPDFDIMRTLKTLLLQEDGAQPIDYFFS